MSLKGETSKLCTVLNDLHYELDKFTNYNNTSNICKIINNLYDTDLKIIVKVLLTIRKINNEKLLEKNNKYAQVYLKEFYKLLGSKNSIDDGDTHPIGQDWSIFSCAAKSQDILNVKRLTDTQIKKKHKNKTCFVKYITECLKFENKRIDPVVKDFSLHTHEYTWFRLMLVGNDLMTTFKLLHKNHIVKEHIHDVHVLAEEFNIIEIYYKRKVKRAQVLMFFNNCPLVKSVIFCSELEFLTKMRIRPCDVFSNILKFYYCYKTNNFNFSVTSVNELHCLHYVYMMYSFFILSPKLSNGSNLTPNPIAGLSYCKPMTKIQPKSGLVEDISQYEKTYIKENGVKSLSDTAVTLESLKFDKRHVLHNINQDRDQRILHGFSNVGGVNQSELVIEQTKKRKDDTIKLMRKISKKH